jgi:HEAT repeat protein
MTLFYRNGPSSSDIDRLKETGDFSSLIRHLGSPDPAVQWHAAEALGTCGEKVLPLLFSALHSSSIPVRLGAIEALGAIGDKRAVTPLLAVADREPVVEVRWAAVLALGETGSPEAVPLLVHLLRAPNRYLRYGAGIALDRLGWQPENEADAVYVLIARQDWESVRCHGTAALPPLWDLLRDDDPATRAVIVGVLGEIGDPHAQAACQKALKDRDSRVRWKAILASLNCGLASHELPLMVAGRERSGPDPAAAAILNFLFLGIGYNYIGKWWGFPVFMTYMSVLVLSQLALGPFLPYLIAYPLTAIAGIHTYYLAERMSESRM